MLGIFHFSLVLFFIFSTLLCGLRGWPLWSTLRLAHYGLNDKSGNLHLLKYYWWLFLCYTCNYEYLWKSLYGPPSLNSLLSGSVLKMSVNPWFISLAPLFSWFQLGSAIAGHGSRLKGRRRGEYWLPDCLCFWAESLRASLGPSLISLLCLYSSNLIPLDSFKPRDDTFLLLLTLEPWNIPSSFMKLCLYQCKEPFIEFSLIYLNVRIPSAPAGTLTNTADKNTQIL